MPTRPLLTEEEFQGWVQHPGTQALRAVLRVWVEEAQLRLAQGYFIKEPVNAAKLCGSHEVCQRLLEFSYEDVLQELTGDEEYKRVETSGPGGAGEAV